MSIKEFVGRKLTIGIGTDHAGFSAKGKLVKLLEGFGHQVVDFGPAVADPADDYPDFSAPAAKALSCGVIDSLVLICRTGFGMAMVANRYHGVRAIVAGTPELAAKGREHNAANCLVIPGSACEDEIAQNKVALKDMISGEQTLLSLEEAAAKVTAGLAVRNAGAPIKEG